MKKTKKNPFIVNRITFPQTKLVDEEGNFHEEVKVKIALKRAKELGLDLVCFDLPRDRKQLPLCKILDFGKFKYRQDKKDKKIKNEQKHHDKEIRLTPVIDDHDVEHKMNQVLDFLEEEDDVTISMKFKGRHKKLWDIGEKRVNNILEKFNLTEISRKSNINMISIQVKQEKEKI